MSVQRREEMGKGGSASNVNEKAIIPGYYGSNVQLWTTGREACLLEWSSNGQAELT